MNVDLKAKWIAALRGGEFQQHRGQLRRNGKYCCLGVLCVVADLPIDEDGECVADSNGGYDALRDLIGNADLVQDLWWANDRDGKDFSEIADIIERRVLSSGQSRLERE